jgi:hypothetical protein
VSFPFGGVEETCDLYLRSPGVPPVTPIFDALPEGLVLDFSRSQSAGN